MNCGMKDDMLLAWVDGDLDQAGRARVAEHIVGCVDCHRTIGDLKDVTGALEKWTVPEPSSLPTARELLDREGVPPSAAPGAGGWMSLVRRYGAVAGIALFATVAGLVILPRYTSPDRSALNAPVPEESKATSAGPASDASRQSGDQAPAGTAANDAVPPATGAATTPAETGSTEHDAVGTVGGTEAGAPGADSQDADGTVAVQAGEEVAKEQEPAAPAPPPAATTQPAAAPEDKAVDNERADSKAGKPDAAAGASGVAPPAPKSLARSAGRREAESAVVRRADVAMSGAEASDVADRVAAAARADGGSVTKRWTRSKDNDADTITVELSVPAENFERTISRLRSVGNVQSVRRSAIDLSGRIAEIDDELADERKNEDAPATAKKQKAPSRDSLQRERRSLEARAERAVITVTIVGRP